MKLAITGNPDATYTDLSKALKAADLNITEIVTTTGGLGRAITQWAGLYSVPISTSDQDVDEVITLKEASEMEIEGLEESSTPEVEVQPEGPVRKPCPECGKDCAWLADGSRPRQHKCVPKEEPVPQVKAAPGVITPDMVIAKYIEDRDKKAELNKQIKAIDELQTKRENWLAGSMTKVNEVGKKTISGGCHFTTSTKVSVSDGDAFKKWVREDWENRKYYLTNAAAKDMVVQHVEDEKTPPPGVDYATFKKVIVTKPK